jgi:hypothetical protein
MVDLDKKLLDARREARALRKALGDFVSIVEQCIAQMDATMQGSSSAERGRRMGALVGQLELHKDIAKRHGLGIVKESPARGPR